ncbi:2-epi-valiolone synthase [Gracilaria domingensis]|nr:2-epi-valiolone synthase [Gracilaria domingensis]
MRSYADGIHVVHGGARVQFKRLSNNCFQVFFLDFVDKTIGTDVALDKRHTKLAVSVFSAIRNGLCEQFKSTRRIPCRQVHTVHGGEDTVKHSGGNPSFTVRKQNAQKAVNVDRLAVHDGAFGLHLKNLAEGMSIVDASLKVILPQIGPKLLEHDLNGQLNDAIGHVVVGLEAMLDETRAVLLQQREELGAAHKRQLHDLAHAVDQIALVLRADERLVQKGGNGRVEGTHAVLEPAQRGVVPVDAALDADAGVDNGQQRGRHADVRHSAAVAAGGEADNVQHAAAAKGDDGLPAEQAKLAQAVEDGLHGGEELVVLLAVDEHEFALHAKVVKVVENGARVEAVHLLIDDHKAALVARRHEARGQRRVVRGENGVVDLDRVLDGQLVVVGPAVHLVRLAAVAVVHKDVAGGGRQRTSVSVRARLDDDSGCGGRHGGVGQGGEPGGWAE